MKFVLACLLLVAAAQAADWAKVRPMFMRKMAHYRPPSSQIIGGGKATVGQFKYQVGLILDGSGFCGGSLIANDVVLTAAHCADGTRNFEVHLGALNIRDEGEDGRVIVNSRDGTVHENYNPSTINNDIAVIKLAQAASGPNIAPVRLPSRSQEGESFEGDVSRVSGWGRTSDASPSISDDLKFVDVTVISNSECARSYGSIINASKVCVDTNGGSEGTCNGDSGGPLVITDSDGQPTEIGIVSFGSSAGCESGYPAAFTRVTSYLDWLEANAKIAIRA